MDLSDIHLDRLLAGKDQLSVVEKEQILEQVLARTERSAPAATRAPWMLPRWAFGLMVLAALVPVVWLAANGLRRSEFTPRGGPQVTPSFEVACLDAHGQAGACARGDRMFFSLSPGRFHAFAAVALAPDGKTFWYFPNDERSASIDLSGLKRPDMLDDAITVDDGHVPGDYTLFGVFSEEPLFREQVRRAIQDPGGLAGAVVVRRTLHLEERKAP